MVDERIPEVGAERRLKGIYLGGFEKGLLIPFELYDFDQNTSMGIEYCSRMKDSCFDIIEDVLRSEGASWEQAVFVDAKVRFLGERDTITCPFGVLLVEGLMDVRIGTNLVEAP